MTDSTAACPKPSNARCALARANSAARKCLSGWAWRTLPELPSSAQRKPYASSWRRRKMPSRPAGQSSTRSWQGGSPRSRASTIPNCKGFRPKRANLPPAWRGSKRQPPPRWTMPGRRSGWPPRRSSEAACRTDEANCGAWGRPEAGGRAEEGRGRQGESRAWGGAEHREGKGEWPEPPREGLPPGDRWSPWPQ